MALWERNRWGGVVLNVVSVGCHFIKVKYTKGFHFKCVTQFIRSQNLLKYQLDTFCCCVSSDLHQLPPRGRYMVSQEDLSDGQTNKGVPTFIHPTKAASVDLGPKL